MTTFDSREKAFEDKYAHDEDMIFKARARRNRLFGEWLAQLMGLSGSEVPDYCDSVVKSDLEEIGDDDVLRKVEADIAEKGLNISRHRLEKRLLEFMIEAKAQVAKEA